jgi:hypothetical protein
VMFSFPGDDFAPTHFVEPAHDQSALHPSSLPGLPPESSERQLANVRANQPIPAESDLG